MASVQVLTSTSKSTPTTTPVVIYAAFLQSEFYHKFTHFLVSIFQASKCDTNIPMPVLVQESVATPVPSLTLKFAKFIYQGSGSFTTKMLDVTAEGFSSIVPVENAEGKQVIQSDYSRIGLAVCVSLCYQKTSASFTEATYEQK